MLKKWMCKDGHLAVAMLPHLDRLNSHAAVVTLAPGW
jgi:hypothetical protein